MVQRFAIGDSNRARHDGKKRYFLTGIQSAKLKYVVDFSDVCVGMSIHIVHEQNDMASRCLVYRRGIN